jgi:putative ABC transport system permease protein
MKTITGPLTNAWTAVITHKLRSFLTILGVVIGISAVIILMSVGKGTEASILNQINSLGANLIMIRPGTSNTAGVRSGSVNSLTLEDANAIAASVTGIDGVAPTSTNGMQVVAGNQNMNVMVTGITTGYMTVNKVEMQEGDPISQDQYDRNLKIALIGPNVATNLFPNDDPVGQKIRMGNNIFTIQGMLASKGEGFTSTDNQILVPLSTLQGMVSRSITTNGQHTVSTITVLASDKDLITDVQNQITAVLETRHNIAFGATDDFTMTSTDQITSTISSAMNSLTLMLGAIAGISLLVGGIGVMNIMLVSVMERRREIGIRKALGAKERDIWGQFLLDSALLTLTGGVIGVAIGWGGSTLIGKTGTVQTLVTSDIVILAVGVSIAIGLFFGFYPAWQGSRLDPIQALRSE